MKIDELRNAASACTNMQQLESLFLGDGVAILGHVMPQELKRCYAQNVARLGGLHQDTGEVMEDCGWL